MTIEQAIKHAEEVSNKCQNFVTAHKEDRELGFIQRTEKCAEEHRQLAKWLCEFVELKKKIIYCGECVHYKPMSNHWGTCGVHSSPTEKYRTCQICDHCSWAERKADG